MLDVVRLLKFLVVLAFLIYACKLDLKTRIIPNVVWTKMILVSIPFLIIEIAGIPLSLLLLAAIQFVLVLILSLILFYIGAWGGADAKALIALAIIFPVYPTCFCFPLLGTGSGMFAFATLANSVLISPLLFLYMFFMNVIKEGVGNIRGNVLYYFIGKRVKISEIPKFHNLLEYISEGKLVRAKLGVEPTKERLKELREVGIEKVWVTPTMPFLVFITFGYILAFLVGDVLMYMLHVLFYSL